MAATFSTAMNSVLSIRIWTAVLYTYFKLNKARQRIQECYFTEISVDQKDQLNVPALNEHLKSVSFLNYNFIAHPWIAQCIQLSEGGSVLLIIKVSTATVFLF